MLGSLLRRQSLALWLAALSWRWRRGIARSLCPLLMLCIFEPDTTDVPLPQAGPIQTKIAIDLTVESMTDVMQQMSLSVTSIMHVYSASIIPVW